MSRKKDSPRPSVRCGCGDLHPAPPPFLTSFLEGLTVWSLWLAAHSCGKANPSCLSRLDGFMKSAVLDAIRFRSYASKALAKVPTMILCETRGLQLFWVIRGRIGLSR